MQSRWTYVVTGVLAGVVGVLLTMVLAQNREPQAWAAPMQAQQSPDTLQMYAGGSQNNINDVIWIVYKRASTGGGDKKDSILAKAEKITLCCYQVGNGARNVKLVAVRDITFDIDLVEYGNDKPHVKEIVEELKKAEKK